MSGFRALMLLAAIFLSSASVAEAFPECRPQGPKVVTARDTWDMPFNPKCDIKKDKEYATNAECGCAGVKDRCTVTIRGVTKRFGERNAQGRCNVRRLQGGEGCPDPSDQKNCT